MALDLTHIKEARVITHNDLDASGVVIVLRSANIAIKSISYNSYQTVDREIRTKLCDPSNTPIIIADICPTRSTCEAIDNAKVKTYLFDHHKTRKFVAKYPWAEFSANECSTNQVFNSVKSRIKNPDYEKLVSAINAWDVWKLSSPDRQRGERLNSLIGFIGIVDFTELFVNNPRTDKENQIIKEIIKYITVRKNRYVKQVIKTQFPEVLVHTDGFNNKFSIIVATEFISEIGDYVLNHQQFEDIDYVCMINPNANTVSLRARVGAHIDVQKIAKYFGGGGHVSAAGFYANTADQIKNIIVEKLNKLNY